MAEILISTITNKTDTTEGTGFFDVLMNSTKLQLNEQYDDGRITGAEYATVYLGALQSTLQSAITFALEEQNADKKAELTAVQVEEAKEKVDLVIAQTAKVYEDVRASESKTIRENLLNNSAIAKLQSEITLTNSRNAEELAGTTRKDAESIAAISNINHEIAIKKQQEFTLKDKNGGVVIEYTYYLDGVSGTTGTTTDLTQVVGPVVSTDILAGTTVSEVALEKLILQSKEDLIQAQTTGFYSDTKQKVLKQIMDGWSVAYTVGADATLPKYFNGVATEGSVTAASSAIDTIIQSIINDAQQP